MRYFANLKERKEMKEKEEKRKKEKEMEQAQYETDQERLSTISMLNKDILFSKDSIECVEETI